VRARVGRHEEQGLSALADRSHRSHAHPWQLGSDIEASCASCAVRSTLGTAAARHELERKGIDPGAGGPRLVGQAGGVAAAPSLRMYDSWSPFRFGALDTIDVSRSVDEPGGGFGFVPQTATDIPSLVRELLRTAVIQAVVFLNGKANLQEAVVPHRGLDRDSAKGSGSRDAHRNCPNTCPGLNKQVRASGGVGLEPTILRAIVFKAVQNSPTPLGTDPLPPGASASGGSDHV
jgi:hypothetical protein